MTSIRKLNIGKIIGLAVVCLGIGVDVIMISIIFSILSGVTIVLSRSVNGMLSKKMGAYQGTFYNYFTGFMTSLILMLVLMIVGVQHINISLDKTNLMMYFRWNHRGF